MADQAMANKVDVFILLLLLFVLALPVPLEEVVVLFAVDDGGCCCVTRIASSMALVVWYPSRNETCNMACKIDAYCNISAIAVVDAGF